MNDTGPPRRTRTNVIGTGSPRFPTWRAGRRIRLACLTGALLLASPAPLAGAAGEGSGSSTEDAIEAEVRYDTDGSDEPGCSWSMVTGIDPSTGVTRHLPTSRLVKGEPWTLYERICGTRRTLHWVRTGTADNVAHSARDRASRLVPTLLVRTAPAANRMVVNVGTWFWVPARLWRPVSVTAMLPTSAGPIIVTTTAVPTHLIFSPGDGGRPVVCRGPGMPWRRSYGDSTRSRCMYTYSRASHTRRSGTFDARLSVQWTVTWTSNLGVGGRLPSIRLGIDTDARVMEMQALTR